MSFRFSIQKIKDAASGFAVKVEAEHGNPLPRFSSWQALANGKEKTEQELLLFLAKEGVPSEDNPWVINVSSRSSLKALKLFGGNRPFIFEGRSLVADFFTPVECYYVVEGSTELSIRVMLKTSKEEFSTRDCDFIAGGPPHWFIRGSFCG